MKGKIRQYEMYFTKAQATKKVKELSEQGYQAEVREGEFGIWYVFALQDEYGRLKKRKRIAAPAKRFPAVRGTKPFQEFPGRET